MRSLHDRLWDKIEVGGADDCWLWRGATLPHGYGKIGEGGRGCRTLLAHRAVWEDVVGPVPDGICVLHTCDTPGCCNPGHLFLGTHKDNTADMDAKGRRGAPGPRPAIRGERHPQAKLTKGDVVQIRDRATRETQAALARDFGVSQSQVWRIVRGLRWAA